MRNASVRRLTGLLTFLALLALPVQGQAQSEAPRAGIESITSGELTGLLKFYSSDWFEGRATLTPGYDMATDFLASQLAAAGIQPRGDDGTYFQRFHLESYSLTDQMSFALVRSGTRTVYEPGTDFSLERQDVSWDLEAPVVFGGFGIRSEEAGWDDLAGVDVEGKYVVVVDGFPGIGTDSSPLGEMSQAMRYASSRAKRFVLEEMGAAGMILVPHPRIPERTQVYSMERMQRLSRFDLASDRDDVPFPMAIVSSEVADDLLGAEALAGAVLRMEEQGAPVGLQVRGVSAHSAAEVEVHREPTQNVIGIMEGTDLKDEYVAIGAHADHVGRRGDVVYNGADDDGSGSVLLLELAEAFAVAAEAGHRPRRSIIFGWWAGEEMGLLGASYYTDNPLAPLDRTVGLIQMDMVGRNEEYDPRKSRGLPQETAEQNVNAVNIIGYSYSSDMQELMRRANEEVGLDIKFRYDAGTQNLLRRSDHWMFLQKGVPVAFLFTGIHPDYHEPTDTWEKINYPKMERIGKMAFRAAWELATTDTPPMLNPDVELPQ